MAAVLKKRALAEYSQVIQEEQSRAPPLKRLRLKLRPPAAVTEPSSLSLDGATRPLDRLLRFEQLPPPGVGCVNNSVRQLLEILYNENDDTVQVKAVAMLADLARSPTFDSTQMIGELIALASSKKSQKIVCQLIATLTVIGRSLSHDQKLHCQLVSVALDKLKSSSHLVRCKCLELIASLGSPDQQARLSDQSERNDLGRALREYTHDGDSRVRTTAFKALLTWHQRGIRLDEAVYGNAISALSDDYEQVRLVAIKVVFVISQLYPESLIHVEEMGEHMRLVDDGFVKICNMVNDLSMEVRAAAAGLLGSLHAVSPKFLEQTLDKKLMSNMRRKMTAHERQREQYKTGGWSSGQKWADDKPLEEVSADDVSLMASGACGAFIHGLEDEFLEVRNAALDSLCELATGSAPFANLAEDFMVDMFNDEIESVRLNAIGSLRKIGHHMRLREDQLEIILNLLKDYSDEIREALRDMFCAVHLGTKNSLNACVLALLDNITRYPQDKQSIWRCMKFLGLNQPDLTLPLVPTLLSTHPYFDSLEPDVEDPAYVAVLMLVFNAARDNDVITTLFPDYLSRHYRFLRQSLGHLVPPLQFPGSGELSAGETSSVQTGTAAMQFLSQTMSRLDGLQKLDRGAAEQLMQLAIRDLERVADVDENLAATAHCSSMFLDCQLCLCQVLHSATWHTTAEVNVTAKKVTEKVGSLTLKMEQLFVGLSTADVCAIRQLVLCMHALHLVAEMTTKTATCGKAVASFGIVVEEMKKLLSASNIPGDAMTKAILAVDLSRPAGTLCASLIAALGHHCVAALLPTNRLQRAAAVVIEPSGISDHAITFGAGLSVGISVVADVANVTDVHRLRVKLEYPDRQSHLVCIRPTEVRPLCKLRHRVHTEVPVSHGLWSESGYVTVCIVLICPQEGANGDDKHVELCAPVKVQIAPKSHQR